MGVNRTEGRFWGQNFCQKGPYLVKISQKWHLIDPKTSIFTLFSQEILPTCFGTLKITKTGLKLT